MIYLHRIFSINFTTCFWKRNEIRCHGDQGAVSSWIPDSAIRGVAGGESCRDVGNGICLSRSTMAEEQSQAQTLPHATQMALAATHTHISYMHAYIDRQTDTSRICCALAQHAVAIKSLATSGAINGSTICTGTKQSSSATPSHCVPPLPLPCLANNWLALSTGFADHTHTHKHTDTHWCAENP